MLNILPIKIYCYPFLLFCFLLSLGCQEQAEDAVEKEMSRPAKIFVVRAPDAKQIRKFPAEVAATNKSELAFRVSGQLIELPITAGQEVKEGDLLAKLDPKDFQHRLDDKRAKYNLAKTQLERAEKILEKKFISQAEYDEKKASYIIAQSDLKLAQADMSYTKLTAPYGGVISKIFVENFENVQAKQPILNLQSRGVIDIVFQLPEAFIPDLGRNDSDDSGYKPKVIFDAKPEYTFNAFYKEHDSEVDQQTLTYRVTLSMESPAEFNVLPGMTASVLVDFSQINKTQQSVFIVPVEAVFEAEDSKKKYVWKVDHEMRAERVEVEVGSVRSNGIEVISGIKTGENIVAAGVHQVTDNMLIRPLTKERGL